MRPTSHFRQEIGRRCPSQFTCRLPLFFLQNSSPQNSPDWKTNISSALAQGFPKLPASQLPFLTELSSRALPSWISCHSPEISQYSCENSTKYLAAPFGAVPCSLGTTAHYSFLLHTSFSALSCFSPYPGGGQSRCTITRKGDRRIWLTPLQESRRLGLALLRSAATTVALKVYMF